MSEGVQEAASQHLCFKCMHLKPVNPRSLLPPADAIGWCKKIHWPFYWVVSRETAVTECAYFEPKQP